MICSFQKPKSSSEITPTMTYETTVSRSVGSRLSFIKEMASSTPCGPHHRTPCGFSPHLSIVHTITCITGVQDLAHRNRQPYCHSRWPPEPVEKGEQSDGDHGIDQRRDQDWTRDVGFIPLRQQGPRRYGEDSVME